ncbi:MAG: Mur ligase family protein, partial [Defluviitaleaceae bacterium]|nr:Mur ligase family protein [Defluviitaleaceae bacterium]
MIRTMEEAMAFIYKTSWKGSQLGLSRMTELMARVGNVQKDMKFVHIAGTNGKGSTAAMLAAVLTEAGYRTGLYTSPVIHTFGERMQVDGVAVTDAELVALAEQMRPHADAMSDSPTEFERITALALLFFHEKNCDIVVLEVGMGGRLDATNVIDAPEIAVITAIGLDHMAELGNTVEKIAGEKAGIIKKNTTVICHPQEASVERVLRAKCAEENAAIAFVARGGVKPLSRSLDGQTFGYGGIKGLTLPLLGAEQLYNAAVAIEVRTALEKKGWSIPEDALRRGLAGTRWPGRFEIMRRAP